MTQPVSGDNIKQPNVSGQFYPAHPARLQTQLEQFFAAADVAPVAEEVLVLISPHAGYVYSGGVAAYGFKALSEKSYSTIVVLSPSHYYGFDGISVWQEGAFSTPLGEIPVDQAFATELLAQHEKFVYAPPAFDQEHALEVQLPFLQQTFSSFQIVPVIVGQIPFDLAQTLADSLDRLIGERKDVLIVVSSDMSHYHNAKKAEDIDRRSIQAVEALDAKAYYQKCQNRKLEMCGSYPVTAAMLLAKKRGLTSRVMKYAHSGDVSGDMNRVVGYTSMVFLKPADTPVDSVGQGRQERGDEAVEGVAPLTPEQKRRLIDIAKETIWAQVRSGKKLDVTESDPRLQEVEGAFVTIHKHGQLRGCIGNIIGRQPLFLTVRDMAIAAASQDPRFSPVQPEELDDIDVEVSVLSQPRICTSVDEIVMGKHGVIVKKGMFHQGVYLPQVATETGWTREEFLSSLCAHKAGLPPDAWKDPSTRLEIFTADVFSEKDF